MAAPRQNVVRALHRHLPQDPSPALFDRFVVLPFERRFRGTKSEVSCDVLLAQLATCDELSGFLNRTLAALARARERRKFTETAATRRALSELVEANDPLRDWLDQNTTIGPFTTSASEIRTAYNRDAVRGGRAPLANSQFGKRFTAFWPQVSEHRSTTLPKRPWMYVGICLLE